MCAFLSQMRVTWIIAKVASACCGRRKVIVLSFGLSLNTRYDVILCSRIYNEIPHTDAANMRYVSLLSLPARVFHV